MSITLVSTPVDVAGYYGCRTLHSHFISWVVLQGEVAAGYFVPLSNFDVPDSPAQETIWALSLNLAELTSQHIRTKLYAAGLYVAYEGSVPFCSCLANTLNATKESSTGLYSCRYGGGLHKTCG